MKRIIAALSGLVLLWLPVRAQETGGSPSFQDSLRAFRAPVVDSALVGKSIFNLLPSRDRGCRTEVKIRQSASILAAMEAKRSRGPEIEGYRVRIYFDSRQDSRADSENALRRFCRLYPEIPAYRSYRNPFFKVTVGDFRTKSEAIRLLGRIRRDFPSAFVVKDRISYPL